MQNLPKSERLHGRDCLSRLFGEGGKGSAGKVFARAIPGGDGAVRIAAVAGRKLGCAVVRNRMRRRLRAAYRTRKERVPGGWDFVLVARTGLLEAAWQDLARDVILAMERAVSDYSGQRRQGPNR